MPGIDLTAKWRQWKETTRAGICITTISTREKRIMVIFKTEYFSC